MSHLKSSGAQSEKWDEQLFVSLWKHTLWGILCSCRTCGAQHTQGSVWLRSCWKPREPARPTQDALATMIKEKNLRSEGNWFLEGPGRPLLFWNVEGGLPGWWSWLRRWGPVALCWICSPGVCAKEAATFFQYGLPLLTGEAEVPDVCGLSLWGLLAEILYFMSFPYWRKWPGLAPQAAALSYRREQDAFMMASGGSQRSAAADNRRPPWWTGRSRLIASGMLHWQKLPFPPKSSQISSVQDTGRASSHPVLDWLLDMEQEIFIQHYRVLAGNR